MSLPSVSVVVPVHNRIVFLAEAIESIHSQDYGGRVEVIVVDDGSKIPVESIFASRYPTVRFLRQPNKGLGAARQAGAREATGELIAHLDDDDLWPADSLARRVAVLQARPDVGVVAGDIAHLWPHKPATVGYYHGRFPRLERARRHAVSDCPAAWVYDRAALLDAFLLSMPFFAQTILTRREWWEEVGGWDTNSTIFTECYGFCCRATLAGPFAFIDAPVAHIRRGHDQATADTAAGRWQESLALAEWGKRLPPAQQGNITPLIARRLLVQGVKCAMAGRVGRAVRMGILGVALASRAPRQFASRPWRAAGVQPGRA